MYNLNTVTVMGNLVKDPVKTDTSTSIEISNFTIACNRGENVDYIDCVAFNKPASIITQYGSKGKLIAVTGYLKQDRWEKEGNKFSKIVVVANQVYFISQQKPKPEPKTTDNQDIPF